MRLSILPILAALAISPACAEVTLSGHYNDHPFTVGDGYDTTPGQSYSVTPSAQFDRNDGAGLYADNSTVTVTGGQFEDNYGPGLYAVNSSLAISGGQFTGNGGAGVRLNGSTATISGGQFAKDANGGLDIERGSTVTVSGGQFLDNNFNTGSGLSAVNASLTVTGGLFRNNLNGLVDAGSSVVLTGGQFTGNSADLMVYDFQNPATLDVFGDFTGDGFQFTNGLYSLPTGIGFLTVALQDGGGRQILSYSNAGAITLHQVTPAPEPAPMILFTVGGLGLLALARRRAA